MSDISVGHTRDYTKDEARRLYEAICQKPGKRAREYTELARIRYQDMERRLVTMENIGLLLFQDEDGKLWPFAQ